MKDNTEIKSIAEAYISMVSEANPPSSRKDLDIRKDSGDFSNVKVKNINLKGVEYDRFGNFTRASLEKADLRNASLMNSKGKDSVFVKANFDNARLTGSNYSDSNFHSASFKNADLSGTDMSNAIFAEANLTGADLSSAIFVKAYLRNANLSNADLRNTNLKGADLTGANIEDAITNNKTRF